ncbi:AcrR family transcriptional regulator [Sphingobium sp. OAS761]|uniref:TetR/AcrR family transcriptional regulator n=1 Tax=Sphingobium sp. OAS761 TaxID=2817901 RepID=UPI00178A2DA7|nr:AcrR family transcriptional regulator [Sphingobium sp. OAS761]
MKDAQRTRQAILLAAQEAFSTGGYQNTGIRDITARAGVSVALVNRYYGSKERLFEEALADTMTPLTIKDIPRAEFGSRMVSLLLDGVGLRPPPLPMMVLASGDPGARAVTQRLLTKFVYEPMAQWLGPHEGHARAARFMMLSAGLVLYSRIYHLDVLVPEADPSMRQWLLEQFQAMVD